MPGLKSNRPTYPIVPFSDDTPTHPLLVVDFEEVKAGKQEAIDTLFKACSNLGFFYLKNHGVDPEPIFAIGEDTFDLPEEELMKFEQGDGGMSAGFKKAGSTNVDKEGNTDTAYFINVAKDDALHFPTVRQRTYPQPCMDNMETYTRFTRTADEVLQTLMDALEGPLGLPSGTFRKLHPDDQLSGSETRVIRKPAEGEQGFVVEGKKGGVQGASIGAHTDFGSFSMLHGRGTGGLQVLPPGTTEWQYIKPLKGHAVCNVGDTLAVYSGGIFNSNIHRVVPPPPPQDVHTRWSLVYFIRPAFNAALFPLSDLSPKIAEAASQHPTISKMEKGVTAGQWFKRRVAGQRAANRKGPESWGQSRGTEHNPEAA
ncbi:Clavaminate synthase-like protein [Leucosporidium creatinivorum]|uniref:Clavaminate synthase-like protein n=1 Tax=Leucosporidium creatinivorum TaxID=106004 RepID=A0A1Y2F8F4_9BASI|nr:Clavaminate synthase-like protein [Leucosporidium creatinivorum]